MYRCEDCGELFDIPKEIAEGHGAPLPYREYISVCPACESVNFEEYKMSDSVRRTDVLLSILKVMRCINEFCLGRKGVPAPITNARKELRQLFSLCAEDDVINVSPCELDELPKLITTNDVYNLYSRVTGRIADE